MRNPNKCQQRTRQTVTFFAQNPAKKAPVQLTAVASVRKNESNMIKNIVLAVSLTFSISSFATEDKHLEAALSVVDIPEGEQLEKIITGLVDSQISANPSIRPIRKAFEIYYREALQSEEFLYGVAEIQMELFTTAELIQLKEMMSQPIFKKYEENMAEHLSKNMELGQRIFMAKQERLKKLKEIEHKRN